MKHQAQFLKVLLCCFLLAMTLSSKTTAQSEQSPIIGTAKSNNSFLKAAYLDINSTNYEILYFKGTGNINGGGITLISKNNWIISGRIATSTYESPQKPSNYYPYSAPTLPSAIPGLFGDGLLSGLFNQYGNNGSKKSRSGSETCKKNSTCKYNNMKSLSVGKIFNHPDFKSVRISLQGGVTYLSIDEAVDFYNLNNFGYKFRRIEYNKMGSSFRVGVEFPFSKYIGLGLTFDGTLAKQEHIFGAGISLMVGILR